MTRKTSSVLFVAAMMCVLNFQYLSFADTPVKVKNEDLGKKSGGEEDGEVEIKYTVKEMSDTIKRRLSVFPEIATMFGNLLIEEGTDGEKQYFYLTPDRVKLELDMVDKKTLFKLFGRVNTEATRLNTERLMRQLDQQNRLMNTMRQQEMIRQQEIINRTAGVPRAPVVPTANVVSSPPSIPRTYESSQPPKVYQPPAPPPSPPKSR